MPLLDFAKIPERCFSPELTVGEGIFHLKGKSMKAFRKSMKAFIGRHRFDCRFSVSANARRQALVLT